jgi:hypothetical protein
MLSSGSGQGLCGFTPAGMVGLFRRIAETLGEHKAKSFAILINLFLEAGADKRLGNSESDSV